mmetsp:Transcript_10024/g.31383  ORF Transcript_10024/g.31383 Transcript_10024/m.31383 type:complete len:162 (-) Transcript_10024:64-549(-)
MNLLRVASTRFSRAAAAAAPAAARAARPRVPQQQRRVAAKASDMAWSGLTRVSVDEAQTYLETEQAVYLDVRTAAECARGVVPGSVCVPMHPDGGMQFSDTFVDEVKAKLPDTSECILVGCAAGVRSELAIALLAREGGYENLANVEGGMNAWQGMGKPVE